MGRHPAIEDLEQVSPTEVVWGGKKFLYFGGCDYLRMSWHSQVRRAVTEACKNGVNNVGASRCTTGNHPVYAKTEGALSAFFEVPDAVLTGNGYLANIAVGQALRGRVDAVLLDERAHPSLRDAADMLGVRQEEFATCSAANLAKRLRKGPRTVLVMTDAVFATDGRLAPLDEYRKLLPKESMLLADDAHGAGVLGPQGKGSGKYWKIGGPQLIQTITLNKGIGVGGGAVLGSRRLADMIRQKAGAYVASTPISPGMAGGVQASLKILQRSDRRVLQLRRNLDFFCDHLGIERRRFPVVSVESTDATKLIDCLIRSGIHPPFIRYPGGAEGGIFRFSISSAHRRTELKRLAVALSRVHFAIDRA